MPQLNQWNTKQISKQLLEDVYKQASEETWQEISKLIDRDFLIGKRSIRMITYDNREFERIMTNVVKIINKHFKKNVFGILAQKTQEMNSNDTRSS